MKKALEAKIAKFDDELLMESLNHHSTKEEIEDWRNWGNNELRIIANEAHERGLIE